MNIKEALAGKKTYLTSAATVIGALAGYADGSLTPYQAIQLSITAVLAVTVHSKIGRTLNELKTITGG